MKSTIDTGLSKIDPAISQARGQDSQDPNEIGLRVVDISLDDPRLEPFLAARPEATVYHHPTWLRTLRAEYNRAIVILACQDLNGKLAGIFPLMQTRGFPIPIFGELAKARFTSLPRTPIAGPLAVGRKAYAILLDAAIDRVNQEPGVCLQIKTEGPLLDDFADRL